MDRTDLLFAERVVMLFLAERQGNKEQNRDKSRQGTHRASLSEAYCIAEPKREISFAPPGPGLTLRYTPAYKLASEYYLFRRSNMCLHLYVAQMINQILAASASKQSAIPETESARRGRLEGQLRNRRKPLTSAAIAHAPAKGRFSQ